MVLVAGGKDGRAGSEGRRVLGRGGGFCLRGEGCHLFILTSCLRTHLPVALLGGES